MAASMPGSPLGMRWRGWRRRRALPADACIDGSMGWLDGAAARNASARLGVGASASAAERHDSAPILAVRSQFGATPMSKLRLKIAMSIDGFVAGPNQSEQDPLRVGGMRLHEWAFPLNAFRSMH